MIMTSKQTQLKRARCLALALIFTAVANRETLDKAVFNLWQVLRRSRLFRHDSFEPVLSTASFAVWLWLYYFIDRFKLLERYRISSGGGDSERDIEWDMK